MLMRGKILLLVLLIGSFSVPTALAQQGEFEIWPGGRLPAGATKYTAAQTAEMAAKTTDERIAWVESPTLTAYPADPQNATGCGVIICPGGGYNILAWPKEGLEVAEWFNSIGVSAFVLKYRVPRRRPDEIHLEPMQDVQRSIRVVRSQAEKWNIDPNRIGTLGFSAGGHLTVMSGVQFDTKCYEPIDDADQVSCRPDFMCPIYCAYLGDEYDDKQKVGLGKLITVSNETPPTFMTVTWDDALRGAQSALLFAKLREHKVPAELHVFSKGGHGYGMRPSDHAVSQWPSLLEQWLNAQGLLTKK